MEFQEPIEVRYSCKEFEDIPVKQRKPDAILEAGRIAPTGGSRQSQRIVVVRGENHDSF